MDNAAFSMRTPDFGRNSWDRAAVLRIIALAIILSAAAGLRTWGLDRVGYNTEEAVYAGPGAAIAQDPALKELFPSRQNDVAATTLTSTTSVGSGWHALEFHIVINETSSTTEVWLDGVRVNSL